MYKKPEESSGNVLGYEAWGKLTEEELGAVLADVEEAIERFGKVNLRDCAFHAIVNHGFRQELAHIFHTRFG